MRLEKRYLRGKSKRRGTWRCCGVAVPASLCRGAPVMVVACLVLALYSGWTSLLLLLQGSAPALANLFPRKPRIMVGDYPGLLLARHEHRRDPEPKNLWTSPQEIPWKQCDAPSDTYPDSPGPSSGYIQIFLDGGLNQQRIGICNAVAVAKMLNATLLIPEFQVNAVWLDNSKFGDIFDEEHFIRSVSRDVRVVRELPPKLAWSTREHYTTGVHGNRIKLAPMHAPAAWYLANVLPKLHKYHIVAIAPFTHRLAFDSLPPDIQRLRCRVNFHALRFVPAIEELGRKLVARLMDPKRKHIPRGILYAHNEVAADMVAYGKYHSPGGQQQQQQQPQTTQQGYGVREDGQVLNGESLVLGGSQGANGGHIRPLYGGGGVAGVQGVNGEVIARSLRRLLGNREGASGAGQGEWPQWQRGDSEWMQALMRQPGRKKYVALHLRFDQDMVAHSACDYGESEAEKEALAKYRQYAWLGRVDKLRFSAQKLRQMGKCPLTPEEAGLFLAAMGFPPSTPLYIATYQVYGGPSRLAPLRQLFPMLEDKTSLATPEELRPLLGKASHLAALDFYVAFHAQVFVSASAGNMHNVMVGHRSYFGGKKTVNVNMTLMSELLLKFQAPQRTNPGAQGGHTHTQSLGLGPLAFKSERDSAWLELCRRVRLGHKSRLGKIKLRRSDQSIYTYPAPDCLCPQWETVQPVKSSNVSSTNYPTR